MKRRLSAALGPLLVLSLACGGGGAAGVNVAQTASDLEQIGYVGLPSPGATFVMWLDGGIEELRSLYVYVLIPEPRVFSDELALDVSVSGSGAGQALEVSVGLRGVTGLAAGTYQGELTVHACEDADCRDELRGSPFQLPYTIEIKPGITVEPASVSASTAYGSVPARQRVRVTPVWGSMGWWLSDAGGDPSITAVVAEDDPDAIDVSFGEQQPGSYTHTFLVGDRVWYEQAATLATFSEELTVGYEVTGSAQ